MTRITVNDPCLLFALHREARAFLREFQPHQRFPGAPCWARFCGPPWLTVLVLETGVGEANAEKTIQWLLNEPVLGNLPYRPKIILSAGYSGALQEGLQIGDVILATEVADLQGNRWPAPWPGELPPGEWRPPLHPGCLLSVAKPVCTPDEKRSLGKDHQALAVDMETAVLARLCSLREIPFGCVRVISDTVNQALSPQLASLLSGRRVSIPRLLARLVRAPSITGELWRLARDTRLAANRLGQALGELLTLTLPWGREL